MVSHQLYKWTPSLLPSEQRRKHAVSHIITAPMVGSWCRHETSEELLHGKLIQTTSSNAAAPRFVHISMNSLSPLFEQFIFISLSPYSKVPQKHSFLFQLLHFFALYSSPESYIAPNLFFFLTSQQIQNAVVLPRRCSGCPSFHNTTKLHPRYVGAPST